MGAPVSGVTAASRECLGLLTTLSQQMSPKTLAANVTQGQGLLRGMAAVVVC
jgi:hypothetical protein